MAHLRVNSLPLWNHSWIQLIIHDHPSSLWARWRAASPRTNSPSKAPGLDSCLSSKYQHNPSGWSGKMRATVPAASTRLFFGCGYDRLRWKRLSQKPTPEVRGAERRVAMPTELGTGAGQGCHLPGTEMLEGVTTRPASGTAAWRGGVFARESSPGSDRQHTPCCVGMPFAFEPPC